MSFLQGSHVIDLSFYGKLSWLYLSCLPQPTVLFHGAGNWFFIMFRHLHNVHPVHVMCWQRKCVPRSNIDVEMSITVTSRMSSSSTHASASAHTLNTSTRNFLFIQVLFHRFSYYEIIFIFNAQNRIAETKEMFSSKQDARWQVA